MICSSRYALLLIAMVAFGNRAHARSSLCELPIDSSLMTSRIASDATSLRLGEKLDISKLRVLDETFVRHVDAAMVKRVAGPAHTGANTLHIVTCGDDRTVVVGIEMTAEGSLRSEGVISWTHRATTALESQFGHPETTRDGAGVSIWKIIDTDNVGSNVVDYKLVVHNCFLLRNDRSCAMTNISVWLVRAGSHQ